MTLRARLAVALAVLAGLSVVAVAAIGYAATDRRLRDEVDAGLIGAALQLPRERVCDDLAQGAGPLRQLGGLGAIGPGTILQCLGSNGLVTAYFGPPGVPLDRPGGDVTARGQPGRSGGGSGGGSRPPPPPDLSGPWTETFGGQLYRVVALPLLSGGELRVGRSLAETNSVLRSVRDRSVLVGLVIIVLAAAAGLLIARRTTQPVTRLSAAAEAIAATGRLDTAVPAGGDDEIGRLARAFAAMLAALTRSRDQQQRLVQDAGHELRTPLTSLRTNIDTLRRHPALRGEARDRVLADLDSELRELSALVDELIALAVERHDDEPEQAVELGQLAERAADRTRRRTGRTILVDTGPATVVAKPQQLLRAIGNLLDNAVKFAPDGTPIELTVRAGRLQVRDHGPGIATEDLPRVFDRFHRSVDARSLPGSGLGLAIVRQIAEDAGGTVEAANHPDGGAVLTLRLPVASPPDA